MSDIVGDYDVYQTDYGYYFENRYVGEEDCINVYVENNQVTDYEGQTEMPILVKEFLETQGIEVEVTA